MTVFTYLLLLNRYGPILDEFGFYDLLQDFTAQIATPLSKMLYPQYGADSLDSHHGFVVEYKIGKDVDLGFHIDDSEVTINVCLGQQFEGGGLYFEGIRC